MSSTKVEWASSKSVSLSQDDAAVYLGLAYRVPPYVPFRHSSNAVVGSSSSAISGAVAQLSRRRLAH